MPDRRLSVVLGVALTVASVSGLGVYQLLAQAQDDVRVPTMQVAVAVTDLTDGTRLEEGDVALVDMPTAVVPLGAYTTLDSIVDRITRVPVFAGEVMVPRRLAPVGAGAGLEVRITPGKRAMAVEIDEVAGLAGLIQPDSRVDVLVTLTDAETERQHAKLIMSNMRVLSVGSLLDRLPTDELEPTDEPVEAPTTAALEVSPAQAERLAVASSQGRIQLVLRGFGDPDTVPTAGATMQDMMPDLPTPRSTRVSVAPRSAVRVSRPAPAPKATVADVAPDTTPARPDSATVLVFRGDKLTAQRFARPDTSPER
jgi:pilus assembly protein CpaB